MRDYPRRMEEDGMEIPDIEETETNRTHLTETILCLRSPRLTAMTMKAASWEVMLYRW
jgi:hypothetical protein